MTPRPLAALIGALLGCGGGGETETLIDAAPDAPVDGSGCDPDVPRALAPEVFVGPTGLETRIRTLIENATGGLDVNMYSFTTTSIAGELVDAAQRGVPVRVILDASQLTELASMRSIRQQLENGGVEVKPSSSAFPNAHAKYMVIGGAAGEALIMSSNFTLAGFRDQRNYGVIDRERQDVADLAAIFEADWDGQAVELECSRLVVSPRDARLRVLTMISNATKTLDLELYYITDSAIRQAIIAAHNTNVAVRVLLNDSDDFDEPDNEAIANTLTAAGIDVRVLNSPVVHAKLIIADGVALIGSHNMSSTSLQDNREVGLMVREGDGPAIALEQFEDDWAAARVW